MERVMLLFPPELLRAVDARAKRLGKKRSQAVREAVAAWLEAQQQQEFEDLLAEGYREFAGELDASVAEAMPLQIAATEATWRWDD